MRGNVSVDCGFSSRARVGFVTVGLLFLATVKAFGHCDTLDGPVVKAAAEALRTANANHALIWVQERDEAELKLAFRRAVKVRRLGKDARELADTYFFETVVRLHRAGEGEPYTGLKPAGTEVEPIIRIIDAAFETRQRAPLLSQFPVEERDDIRTRFDQVVAISKYDVNNVQAGREYVRRYVGFIHFVEHRFKELN
jgi:hypothetical protein